MSSLTTTSPGDDKYKLLEKLNTQNIDVLSTKASMPHYDGGNTVPITE